jgi:hypothetical protein
VLCSLSGCLTFWSAPNGCACHTSSGDYIVDRRSRQAAHHHNGPCVVCTLDRLGQRSIRNVRSVAAQWQTVMPYCMAVRLSLTQISEVVRVKLSQIGGGVLFSSGSTWPWCCGALKRSHRTRLLKPRKNSATQSDQGQLPGEVRSAGGFKFDTPRFPSRRVTWTSGSVALSEP